MLDSFVETHGLERIALLKVDVEGYEDLVFQGARRLLESGCVKTIYYEVCPALAKAAGFSPQAASSQLLEHGYLLHGFGKNGRLRPVELNEITAVKLENWIAIHP